MAPPAIIPAIDAIQPSARGELELTDAFQHLIDQGSAVPALEIPCGWHDAGDPQSMLLTEEWAAPAVLAWKTVAELFRDGLEAMPAMAPQAMAIGGIAGVVLAVLEKVLSEDARKWVPSPGAMGLALVIPAYYAVSMFLGGVLSVIGHRIDRKWARAFIVVIASGIIAGESLVGVGIAIWDTLKGMAGG